VTATLPTLHAPDARAAAPVRLSYEAPAGCPSSEAFTDAVRAQAKAAKLSAGDEPARRLTVRIMRGERSEGGAGAGEGQLHGRLQIEETDGATSIREVTAATCDDVVAALSLMAAMAIDADPRNDPAKKVKPGPKEASGASGGQGGAAASPSAGTAPSRSPIDRGGRPQTAAGQPRASNPAPADPPPPQDAAETRHWQIGAHGGAFGGVAPVLAWGAVVFVDWSAWNTTGVAPSLRLGLALAESSAVVLAEGQATFRWVAARLGGCPFALSEVPFTVRACGGLDAGLLRGQGSAVARPVEVTRGWIAATAAGRLQVPVSAWLFIEGEAGFTFPFIRDQFVFDRPRRDIHEVPPVSGFATAGISVLVR
jgi:hypothetical protein